MSHINRRQEAEEYEGNYCPCFNRDEASEYDGNYCPCFNCDEDEEAEDD